jgi:hypothetical protein
MGEHVGDGFGDDPLTKSHEGRIRLVGGKPSVVERLCAEPHPRAPSVEGLGERPPHGLWAPQSRLLAGKQERRLAGYPLEPGQREPHQPVPEV